MKTKEEMRELRALKAAASKESSKAWDAHAKQYDKAHYFAMQSEEIKELKKKADDAQAAWMTAESAWLNAIEEFIYGEK